MQATPSPPLRGPWPSQELFRRARISFEDNLSKGQINTLVRQGVTTVGESEKFDNLCILYVIFKRTSYLRAPLYVPPMADGSLTQWVNLQ